MKIFKRKYLVFRLTHSCCKPQAISSKFSALKSFIPLDLNSFKYVSNVTAFSVTT